MAKSSSLKKAFAYGAAALGAISVMGAANDAAAQSLQTGQCVTRDVFNQTLAAEGMRTLILGNRTGIREDASSPTGARGVQFVNGVAANANGQGYLFEGDQPRGVNSSTVCVTALNGVSLYDISSTEIPRSAYLGGRFNFTVDSAAQRGDRPMIVANTVIGSGDARRYGLPVVVFGNASDRTGAITSMSTDGQPTLLAGLTSLDYTPAGQQRLAELRQPQVATLSLSN